MTTDKPPPRFLRDLMLLTALTFIAFGLGFLLLPEQLGAWVELTPRSPTALADMRAIYGGLPLASGVLFWLAWRRTSWFVPGLFLVMASSGAAALSRIYSIVVSGLPRPFVLVFLALELAGFVLALIGYRALQRVDEPRPHAADAALTPR